MSNRRVGQTGMRTLPLWALVSTGIAILVAPDSANAQRIHVVRDAEWTSLLDRDHGWNGADGCISIPLNGIEAPGMDPHPRTLFTFGDSIVGDVGPDGRRLAGNEFINNSMLYVDGLVPDPASSDFIYVRNNGQGHPQSAFLPTTPDAEPGDYFWLMDGIALGDFVHIFGIHLRPPPGGGWPSNQGITMITIGKESRPPFDDQVQIKVPLYAPPNGEIGPYQFPSCIISNTESAGAPHPDGYIYIYGAREDPFIKKAIVARVLPKQFTEFSAWRYWDGADWVEGITNSFPMTGRISGVYSVTPMPDGQYIMVFQKDTIAPEVAIRIGAGPTGPWGPMREIYHCPETDRDPDIYAYNASAHPHLSEPGELLISYSVNSWDFEDVFWIADIGRPRFIRLKLAGN